MPPTTTGPPPPKDAPFALTPFTVVNSLFASNVHTIAPFVVEYARSAPSTDPENTAPGITVIAADCAPLQFGAGPLHTGGGAGVNHARWPLTRLTACRPPGLSRRKSETAKYAFVASTAGPHSMPPSVPPRPARYSHNTAPRLSGSIAQAWPDFWPTTIASLPFDIFTSIGESPRSKSGPMSALFEAQLPAPA